LISERQTFQVNSANIFTSSVFFSTEQILHSIIIEQLIEVNYSRHNQLIGTMSLQVG